MHLQCPYGCDNNDYTRGQTSGAALDIKKFLGTKVCPESGLGNNIVTQLECGFGCNDGIASMCDIRKRATMNKCRIVFQCLYQIGCKSVFQQNSHRPFPFYIAGMDRRSVASISNCNSSKSCLQVLQTVCQTKNCHYFACDCDVKTAFPGKSVGYTAKPACNLSQCPVVHVHHSSPCNSARIHFRRSAPVNRVFDKC